ncbi:hypothetical protein A2767_07280 [Candidatus Roizmanbacteria bacterium RIFCSPHIGHO2_01_FULL_35_10]|uniref:Cohesin domain-containing protein n=1 Tax=Candidatus Roizmanbacteria bacterium RIFCSPLOWO2_01_FULL_35_13 TaxID=1802055 RepID=A0A1F7IDC7_9BACT|nr:MAG: hypothetical protein A2767_07280 [Candidatus Roizmanbacteria bacterium RIFCSPHIGHO2_01_FULL_35_10]OGK41363.1 MAG: hypothetical protein A3A74_03460 [Candidatus Roizmanbacteria bacterium RIFCSPLOWO2_01_FULL_35_13]
MNDQPNKNSKSKLKLILLLVFIVFAVLLLILNRTGKKDKNKQQPAPLVVIPTPIILTEGSLSIQTISTKVTTENTKDIEIIASSNQKSIVAYDIVITHERGALEVLSVESLLPDFKVYPLEKNNHFIITGVKEPESKSNSVFENLPIVKLKILPKKSKNLTLNLVSSLGKEKSQMVDEESKILRPELTYFKLNIN